MTGTGEVMPDKDDKKQRLGTTLDNLKARWGEAALHLPGSGAGQAATASIPTGFVALDRALGIGGVPRGHLTFLQGVPTSGAGTLALKIAASATAAGEAVAYVDLAATFDADYAARCGVDLDRLVVVQIAALPDALDILPVLFPAVGLIVLDPALPPDTPSPDRFIVRRVLALLRGSSCALVALGRGGLESLSEHAALRLDVSRERWLKRRQDVQGYRARVHITRSRFGPAGGEVGITIGFSGAVKGDGV